MTDEALIAQADLRKYKDARRNIKDLKSKIDALSSRINSSTSRLKEMSIQAESQSKEELICILADMRTEYTEQQKQSERTCLMIAEKIGEMQNDFYKLILRNHYLFNQRFEEIASNEHVCYRSVKKCHQRGLNEYAGVFNRMDPEEYQKIKKDTIREDL